MRNLNHLFLLILFIGFSCSQASEGPSNQSETLERTNTTLRKIVDRQLSEAIWTDEKRGRNNDALIAKLKQLANSRKGLDFDDLPQVEAHVSIMKSLQKDMENMEMQRSMDRIEEYLAVCQSDPKNLPLLKAEVGNVEFALGEHWSRQLGVIDCCFPSPMNVQTKEDVRTGEPFEMAVFPGGERTLGNQTAFAYEKIQVEKSGNKDALEITTKQIGHVLILEFTPESPGEYVVHFSVTESGDYLAEPWQQNFEWPIEVR